MAEIKIKGSIRPRGNGYEYVVDVAPKGAKRDQKTGYYATREEAETALIDINNKLKLGQKFDGGTTLKEIITNFYERQVKNKVRETTYHVQMDYVRVIIEHLGDKKIDKITHEDIEEFYQALYDGKKRGKGTVRNVSMILKKTFNYAVTRRYIVYNVAKDVSPGSYKPKRFQVWLPEQVREFLQAMEGTERYAFYCLAFATGMRIGEMLALRPTDLIKATKEIKVERALKKVRGVGYIDDLTKTERSERSIQLPPRVFDLLWSYKNPKAKYLFHREDGSHLIYRTVLKDFRDDAVACDLPLLRLHDIRHTVATTMLSQRMDATVVAEVLGDTVQTVYNTYAHVIPSMRSEAMSVINNSFFIKPVDKTVDNLEK